MTRPERCSETGFTLVEALVALAILAIAAAGGIAVINQAVGQQSRIMERQEAARLARSLLAEVPEVMEGTVQLRQNGPRAVWQIEETVLHSGALGGVELDWARLDVTITWDSNGVENQVDHSAVILRPRQASR